MFKSTRHALFMAIVLSTTVSMAHAQDSKSEGMQGMQGMSDSKAMPMDAMSDMPMTGDQDYDFATMMRSHHKKALPMASKEIKNGKNPEMRHMAQTIFDAQTKQIAQFDSWIAAHKPAANATSGETPFSQLDKNHDGFLTHQELPSTEMLDQHFSVADSNHDGKLSKAEAEKHRADMAMKK